MSLIVGDDNAHHSRWDRKSSDDERSEQLADEFDIYDYTILIENKATRLPTNGSSSSPDMSLVYNDITLLPCRSVSSSPASDRQPILITINFELSTIDGPRRAYINFKKSAWARYAVASDEYLAEAGETRSVEQAEKTFSKAVNKASGVFISTGRVRDFQPALQASAKSIVDKKNRKGRLNPADETLNDLSKTGGGRQTNKMAIRRRQMRSSNRHIASIAVCFGPRR